MDSMSATQAAPEFEVLSDDELADLIGGDLYETMNSTSNFVMRQIGGCQCGVGH